MLRAAFRCSSVPVPLPRVWSSPDGNGSPSRPASCAGRGRARYVRLRTAKTFWTLSLLTQPRPLPFTDPTCLPDGRECFLKSRSETNFRALCKCTVGTFSISPRAFLPASASGSYLRSARLFTVAHTKWSTEGRAQ